MTRDLPPLEELPDRGAAGRAAQSNRTGRYERETRHAVDDGWHLEEGDEAPRVETVVTRDMSRTVIARNDSPDVPFDRSINPYRGCEHGCIYCYARPSHAYLGLSPGLDFETRLLAKHDAASLLERELAKPGYRPEVICLGANTDVYQPLEKKLGITRSVLEVLWRCRHPVTLITKSALVVRDADLLGEMAGARLTHATLSITTLDHRLARAMEPRASTPSRRLRAIEALAARGVPVGVNVAPVIPGLNDHEIESILGAAREAGATTAGYTLVRLPLEIRELFREWLEAERPDRAQRILGLIRQTRGGRLNESAFGKRMQGEGPFADLIRQRFRIAVTRHGLDRRDFRLDTSRFRPPEPPVSPQGRQRRRKEEGDQPRLAL